MGSRIVHGPVLAVLDAGILTLTLNRPAESLAQTALLATDDHREGLAAARERREPEFLAR